MKKTLAILGLTAMFGIAVQAVTQPVIPPGMIAVFKGGTSDTSWPMGTSRAQPTFVQVFNPGLSNAAPVISVAMATNASVPGSVWINAHAGSEGGGLSRSIDRSFLALEGYTGNILSPTASKPSTDPTVYRGIVALDPFTNAVDVYSDQHFWFGIPVGSSPSTQDNPTGIAAMDKNNFWGSGNFAGISGELDGMLYYNPNLNIDQDSQDTGYYGHAQPVEVQNYLQGAYEARIIGGTLYVAGEPGVGGNSGIYNFIDNQGSVVPLPQSPLTPSYNGGFDGYTYTNLFLNWGAKFTKVANFDMNPQATVAYGADQTYGIIKFTNNAGIWQQAPYFFTTTNIGTTAQVAASQGCFGICVDFSGTNPVIYATTMESGATTNYPGGFPINSKQGHQNNNRLIKIVDTGVNPGTNLVAVTLAVATTTNEFFGGIDFTPDLRPLITANPASYNTTTNGGIAPFSVTVADSPYSTNYQWFANGSTLLAGQTNSTLTVTNYDFSNNNNTYQCVVTNDYGAVTSTPALLVLTASSVTPVITSGTNYPVGYLYNNVAFAPVTATNTEPFTYQWYVGGQPLSDSVVNASGSGYVGSQTASLTVTNLQLSDATNYWLVVSNAAGYASNLVDVLTVNYHTAVLSLSLPASATTFVNSPITLTCPEGGATLPVTYQWFGCSLTASNTIASSYALAGAEYSGINTGSLTVNATTTADSTNYYCVVSNGGGSVTSVVATVTVLLPPALSAVTYSNQLYLQTFDSLPDPGYQGITAGVATGNGVSVNSINNPMDPGSINGVAYSLANPFDFTYPVVLNNYVGGLGLGSTMSGWYGSAATKNTGNPSDYPGVDGITRFGAQDGDQSTGGVIDFGLNDIEGGIVGTNRALGLLATGTTGPTTFALKLTNNTPNTLNYLNLSFIGELWRNGSQPRIMQFGYTVDNTATNFQLTSDSISNATLVTSLNFSFPTTNGGPYNIDGTQPMNQTKLSVTNLALATPWTNGGALWLIWSLDYNGQGSGNGYAIDNVAVNTTTNLVAYANPTISDLGASNISITNAMLNYAVNPNNWPITYAIYYGLNINPATNGGLLLASGTLPAGSSSVNFSNVATGLLPGTVYHYQIVANNFAGSSATPDDAFTTPAALPTATTAAATAIGTTSAYFNATINPQGAALAYWFNYGTTTGYGSSTVTNYLASGINSSVSVSNLITSLPMGVTNHYQIEVSGIPGILLGSDKNFVTLSTTPAVVTTAASKIFGTAATLNGTVNPEFGATAAWFVYGTNNTTALTNLTAVSSLGTSNGVATVSTAITGLLTNTTYYFEIVATNYAGTNTGSILNFTTATVSSAPVAVTLWGTNILGTTAGLVGSVNPNNDAATYWFVYGTNNTTAFNNLTAPQTLAAGTSAKTNTVAASGLLPATTYYFAIEASNIAGTNYGATNSFTTAAVPSAPTVATLPATNILARSASLVGSVTTNNDAATSWWFVYGTNNTTALTNLTASTVLVNTNNQLVYTNSTAISGLLPATTYYFEIAALNYTGTNYGAVSNFTTASLLSAPIVTTSAATGVTNNSAVFKGTVNPTNDAAIAWFIYGTNNSSAFTNIAAIAVAKGGTANTVAAGITAVTITSTNSGLFPNTTYYFQAVATNTVGVGMGVTNNFTTSNQVPALAPMVVQGITATSATLGATVNPNNAQTGYWFQYGTNNTLTGTTGYSATNILAASYNTANAGTTVTGLLPGTIYYFQVGGTNAGGTNTSWNNSFTTLPVTAPTVTTLAASNINASAATLAASVNPNNGATGYWFIYGTNSLTSFTITNTLVAGASAVTVTSPISGLLAGTTYYFEILATNSAGTGSGLTNSFATLAVTPSQVGGVKFSSGGNFTFAFTNATGASFSILATNNLTVPVSSWPVVGAAVENPAGSGNYQYTNTSATNGQQFYIIRQP